MESSLCLSSIVSNAVTLLVGIFKISELEAQRMTGYCKYCDSVIDDNEMLRVFDSDKHQLVWVGCLPCYNKRTELMR